jgi:hypothetical protein
MKKVSNILSAVDLQAVSQLIGSKLERVWGPYMHHWPNRISSVCVFIDTTKIQLCLSGDIDALGYWEGEDGWPAQYSKFVVNSPAPGYANIDPWTKALKDGCVYYFHTGEVITDILFEFETMSFFHNGVHQWDYTTDIAMIIVLSGGYMAISKMGFNDELLRVNFGKDLSKFVVPELDSYWIDPEEEELGIEFRPTRERIPIAQLLEA